MKTLKVLPECLARNPNTFCHTLLIEHRLKNMFTVQERTEHNLCVFSFIRF